MLSCRDESRIKMLQVWLPHLSKEAGCLLLRIVLASQGFQLIKELPASEELQNYDHLLAIVLHPLTLDNVGMAQLL